MCLSFDGGRNRSSWSLTVSASGALRGVRGRLTVQMPPNTYKHYLHFLRKNTVEGTAAVSPTQAPGGIPGVEPPQHSRASGGHPPPCRRGARGPRGQVLPAAASSSASGTDGASLDRGPEATSCTPLFSGFLTFKTWLKTAALP